MKPTLLYRIASGVFIFIAASHTYGLLTDKASSPELLGVRQAMNNVHFQLMGANCSYGDWYVGFGLLFTAYSLFSAFLAWHLVAWLERILIQSGSWRGAFSRLR
jgi:hypothetical protein